MPDLVKVLVIAVVQGLTEFLPVSSSAHIVFARHLLDLETSGADFEVALHLGTLIAVLIFYRCRFSELVCGVLRRERDPIRYVLLLATASVPAVLVYLLLHDSIESCFSSPRMAAVFLCVTGAGLLSMRWTGRRPERAIGTGSALAMGVAQAFALLPGISRSGATLLAGRVAGAERKTVVEFSLLMSVIAVGGAALLKIVHLSSTVSGLGYGTLGLGVAVSAGVGYAAISWLVRLMATDKLWLLGFYCLAAGGLALRLFSVTGS